MGPLPAVPADVDPALLSFWHWANLVGNTGCALWILAYVLSLVKAQRDRAPGLPTLAICLNFSWEFLYAFVLPNPVGLWRFFGTAWFFLDIAIVYQLLRFGPAHQSNPWMARHFSLAVASSRTTALDARSAVPPNAATALAGAATGHGKSWRAA